MIKALIVENEKESSHALELLLKEYCKDVSVLAVAEDIESAFGYIVSHSPDLIFLDVELSGESGFDLLEKVTVPTFEVIFTTAFSNYALRAIKHACLDYLMKPISIDELKSAIEKFREKEKVKGYKDQVKVLLENLKSPAYEAKICIPSSDGFAFLIKSEIIMCKAEAAYSIIYTIAGENIICSKNLGVLEEQLDDVNLFRCHKSYLINMNYVKKFWKNGNHHVLMFGELQAEISLSKKSELFERLENQGYVINEEPQEEYSAELALVSKNYQNLSIREIEIVRCVAKGMGGKEIANKLFIAEATVKTHRKNMLFKTQAKNTSELVHYATLFKLI